MLKGLNIVAYTDLKVNFVGESKFINVENAHIAAKSFDDVSKSSALLAQFSDLSVKVFCIGVLGIVAFHLTLKSHNLSSNL